jgi:hypothetical protein
MVASVAPRPISQLCSRKLLGDEGRGRIELGENGFEREDPRRERVVIRFDGAF